VYGEQMFIINDRGVLTCHNVQTGEQLYQRRINDDGASFSASPVAADGKVYFASEDGDVYVLQASAQFKLLAINAMGETLMATPAISDGVLFVRGQNHLFAIAAKATTPSADE
jgi:outer membrane protein assembly factor BamB